MSEDMPGDMPDRMPEDMPGRMPEDMPDKMLDIMLEDMSDRMPEDLPVTKRIDVIVGMTRSKVIVVFGLLGAQVGKEKGKDNKINNSRPVPAMSWTIANHTNARDGGCVWKTPQQNAS